MKKGGRVKLNIFQIGKPAAGRMSERQAVSPSVGAVGMVEEQFADAARCNHCMLGKYRIHLLGDLIENESAEASGSFVAFGAVLIVVRRHQQVDSGGMPDTRNIG